MPNESPKLYDLKKTTIGFSIASIVLFVGLVMMVFQDSDREWKGYQREFMDLTRETAEAQIREVEKTEDASKKEELKKNLAAAKEEAAGHHSQIQQIQSALAKLEVELAKANSRFQGYKQEQDSDRYFFEEARAHAEKEKTGRYQKALEKRGP